MLFLLIAITWLTIIALVIGACQAAACAEERDSSAVNSRGRSLGGGLVIFEEPAPTVDRARFGSSLPVRHRSLCRLPHTGARRRRIAHGIR
ncbi:MAG: hypothetical protein M3Z95_08420 [Actinomycetota bacterium]|nr:hypothetical protein [Actinomycetota bacterium]